MKHQQKTPLDNLVCKHVKQLLNERCISVRQLAIGISRDHSQLNKILHGEANLPAYLIWTLRYWTPQAAIGNRQGNTQRNIAEHRTDYGNSSVIRCCDQRGQIVLADETCYNTRTK